MPILLRVAKFVQHMSGPRVLVEARIRDFLRLQLF